MSSKAIQQFAAHAGGPIGVAVALLGVAGTLYFLFGKQIKDAAAAAANAVNPTSDKNLAYRGVNAVGEVLSGDESFSLGSWLYDVTHPNEGKLISTTPPYVPRSTAVKEEAAWYERLLGP